MGIVNTATLKTLQGIFARILRYNPEIEKVEITLLNYEDIRNELSSMIDNYFPLITISELDKIWQLINNAIYTLDKLAYSGNDILLKYQQQSLRGFSVYGYNRIHSNFKRQIERLLLYLESIELQSARQEKNSSITKEIENKLTRLIDTDPT